MSYPLHKTPGGAAARSVRTETGFWGLDLSEGASDRPFSRAIDTENLIWDGEALKVRSGYRKLESFPDKINGIFFYQERTLVHSGTGLFCIRPGWETEKLLVTMADAPSQGVVRRQTVTGRMCLSPYSCQWYRRVVTKDFLFIHDGSNYYFYDGNEIHTVADQHWNADMYELYSQDFIGEFYATIPFTAVAKRPDGGGDVDPRGDNRLSQFRCESFYVKSGEEVRNFRLNCLLSDYNTKMAPEIQLRDSEGIWRCIASMDIKHSADRENQLVQIMTPTIKGGTNFRYNDWDCIVDLQAGDCVFVDDGMDNVRITYGVLKDPPDGLTGASAFGLYGADGADDVLFLGGSEAAPGEDAFSAPNDFFCFYSTATERLGNDHTPVSGYCRLSDGRLAVLKNDPNGSAVFFRDHRQVELGLTRSGERYLADAYPSKSGAGVEGCLTPFSVGVAGNEPCFLAKSGLYSVRSVSDELINLNETVRRSMPIDPLLTRLPPQNARSICWKTYYLLSFGNTVFITDGRRDGAGQLRFLKWTLAHSVSALAQKDGALYMGDDEGDIYLFDGSDTDGGEPIRAFWKTSDLEEKSGRRMILRQLWAEVNPGYDAGLRVRMLKDHIPMEERSVSLHRLDFGALDFAHFTFEGCGDARWVLLEGNPVRADRLGLRVDFFEGGDLKLWGFRMIYDKGGRMC